MSRTDATGVCATCGGVERRTLAREYVFVLSSFEGVELRALLEGVAVRECAGCGCAGVVIPCLEELLWKITEMLLLGEVPEGSTRWEHAKLRHVRSFAEGVLMQGSEYTPPVTAVWERLPAKRGPEQLRAPWWVEAFASELKRLVPRWRPQPGEPLVRFRYVGSAFEGLGSSPR